jgi:hypothetical protein
LRPTLAAPRTAGDTPRTRARAPEAYALFAQTAGHERFRVVLDYIGEGPAREPWTKHSSRAERGYAELADREPHDPPGTY